MTRAMQAAVHRWHAWLPRPQTTTALPWPSRQHADDEVFLWLQVLEGYLYLGNLKQLGAELATAFTNALDETCLLQVPPVRRVQLPL